MRQKQGRRYEESITESNVPTSTNTGLFRARFSISKTHKTSWEVNHNYSQLDMSSTMAGSQRSKSLSLSVTPSINRVILPEKSPIA